MRMLILVVGLLVLEIGAVGVAVGSSASATATSVDVVPVVAVVQGGRGRSRAVGQGAVAQDWGGSSTGRPTHQTAAVAHVQTHKMTIDAVGARRQSRRKACQ